MFNKNHIIFTYLIKDKLIDKDEYDILFKNFEYWETNKDSLNIDFFHKVLKKIINLQQENDVIYLSGITFPDNLEFKDLEISPTKEISFGYCSFVGNVNFYGVDFKKDIDFTNVKFYKNIDFRKTNFFGKVRCNNCSFFGASDFKNTTFHDNADFSNSIFNELDFTSAVFHKELNFNNSEFNKKTYFSNVVHKHISSFSFAKCAFKGELTSFSNCELDSAFFSDSKFYTETNFMGIICKQQSFFDNLVFLDKVSFNQSKFYDSTTFDNTQFENAYYFGAIFKKEVSFRNAISNKIIELEHVSCAILDMKNSDFKNVNLVNIKGDNYFPLKKKNIKNKETARIIKSHLEKQHNIIEANKFFVFEQDKYYEELSWLKNFGNKFVVALNKIVSNHQTSWIQVFFWIIFFSLIVLVLHDGFPKNISVIPNKAVELINPLNVFKNNDLYKNNEFWAMIVRITTIYLFWQFTTAFRQNTRRK